MKIVSVLSVAMLVLLSSVSSFAQKKIKEGVVKFEMSTEGGDSPELAMLAGSTLDFYFTDDNQRMDMSMMGGMMRVQTFVPTSKPADAALFMDMMGQKMQIVELTEDDLANSNSFMNMDGVDSVTYDAADKKDIIGYPCYKARVKMKNGSSMTYYITEKIQPPVGVKTKNSGGLKGYPLEMSIDTGQGFEMVFKAKEIKTSVDKASFTAPEGYTKMTMEEFQKQMGGSLNLSPGGN